MDTNLNFDNMIRSLECFDQPVLVQDFLEKKGHRLNGKTALVCGPLRYSYGQLDEWTNRVARELIDLGVNRGDRICICLQNTIEAVVAIFATLKAGAVFVPIHPSTKKSKLEYIINNCEATVLFTDTSSYPLAKLADVTAKIPSLMVVILCGKDNENESLGDSRIKCFHGFGVDQASNPLPRVNQVSDLACLIYTSGSTGEPKGVMSTHGNVVFAASSIATYLDNRESDIVLCVLPLSFDYGLYQLLMTFLFGGTLVLEKSFTFPASVLKIVEKEKVTGFPGVPTVFSMLLKLDLSKFDLSSIRYLTNTAAALPSSHIETMIDRFPGVQIHSMYGLTETKRTLQLPPPYLRIRPDSVGIPIPGTQAWLEDSSGNRLPNGGTGELVVRGPHVMQGYWGAPELSSKRFKIGSNPAENLCYTGDLFRTDEDGFFYFIGRQDDIIKSRGEKVAPKEVENVIYGLPGVEEVAVVGVPDPILGQAVKAFVTLSDASLCDRTILMHCKKNLEEIMVPKYIEIRDSLPRTSSGKLDKKVLI